MRCFVFALFVMAAPPVAADVLSEVLRWEGYVAVDMTPLPTGHRTVGVTLNGQIGHFIVDSGASQTVIDRQAATLFPLRRSEVAAGVTGALGPLQAEVKAVSAYAVGPVAGGGLDIIVADLRPILEAVEAAGGGVVDGVLGQDILVTHGAIIDLAGDRLFLQP